MSEDAGRSPKRQRLDSYSPASPPITSDPKEQTQPNTPPPSVRMSPSWSQQGQQTLPGLGMQGQPTPPNTGSSVSFQSGGVSTGGSSMLEEQQTQEQTPATTVGDAGEAREDRDEGSGGEAEGGDTQMEDADNRRTDHEREREKKDDPSAGILYKLSTEPIPPSNPPPSADLISLYGLKPLQQSVARKDPTTGAKINVLRKTYTGKVKDLGLEGKNKASKNQNELIGLVDPAWSTVFPDGSTMWQQQRGEAVLGEHDVNGLLGMLDTALGGMKGGHLPRNERDHWKSLLGLDEPAPTTAQPLAAGSKTGAPNPNFLAKAAPGTAPGALRNSAPASPANGRIPARPERAGKKRRYDESSYEGYDDDGYDTGNGNGMEDRRNSGGAKRQKKSPAFATNSGTGVGVK